MKRLRPFFLSVLLPVCALASAVPAAHDGTGENQPAIPGAPSVEELDAAAAAKAAVFAAHPDPEGAREAAAFEAGTAIASRAPAVALAARASAPTHTVYGWAPYWQTSSDIASYEYSNLTHVAYFSYEVNPTNGGCLNMHGWTTTPLVETAHSNGVKVVLTATLFGSAGNKLLLTNSAACNKLATNLVNAVVSRGGDGICIDFESVGSWTGATAALNKFMTNLIAKAHAANLEVGIALPSVDWYADFGVAVYEAAGIDQMLVMGYDYYYAGSSTPGPVAPLKSSAKWVGATSWCSVDYSVRYYLGKLSSPSKLMLAVPFYGRRWGAKSAALGAESLGSSYSSALEYASCASLASTYGRRWETNASVPYCVYTNASVVRQCFYDDAESLGLKFDYAKTNSLGGIGIWCLTQAHSDLWDAVADAFGGAEGGDAGDDDNTGSETGGIDATELVSWDFTAAEGWVKNTNDYTGITNAAGGAWYFKDIDVYPAAVNDADTGYLDLQVATDYLFTPVSTNWSVTRIETVARPYSTNAAGRELTLLGSTNGGTTWKALGSFRMTTPNANTTNSLTLPAPLSGSVRIAVSNSASYSIKLCRLSLFGVDISGDDTAVEETGGDGDASGSNPSWWFEFVSSEGWTTRSTDYTGATNAAGGTWSFSAAQAYPANAYDGNTGAIYLNLPSNSIRTPVFTNASYSSATVVARPYSGGSNREMTLLGSTNGGTSFGILGSFQLPATANSTNVFSFERPLAGNVVLAVSNSGTAGSLYVLALGLAATATNTPPAPDTTAVSRWFDFIPSEGWTQHTNNYTGTTNAASGTWHFQAIRTTPSATYDGNAGSLGVYNPNGSSSLRTPVFANESLSSVTLVARPYTAGTPRELTLSVSTDGGGTFADAGSMTPTAAVNLTNTFAFSPPRSGDIVLKVVNSGTSGSIRLLALGTEGTKPDEDGGEEEPEGAVIATYDFVSSEGWVENTNDFTGTTNAAGGEWYCKDIDVYPTDRNDTDIGYLDLQRPGDYLFSPLMSNVTVTGAVTVARPYSTDADGRHLTLLASTNGGSTWTSLGSFAMTSSSTNTPNSLTLATPLVGDVRIAVSNSSPKRGSLKLCSLSILGTTNSSSGGGDSGGGGGGEGGGDSGGGDSGGGSAIDVPTVNGLPSADAEQPSGVLSGVTVFTSGGHGYTANNADTPTYWYTGRGNTHDVNEDTGNLDQLNFFAEEAWRMGATVVPMRPLGHQTNEVVLDNTSPSVSFTGNWANSSVTNYFFGRKGAVAYRYANANPTGVTATAVYRPSLPAAGEYPVYTWVRHGSDRVNQHYRIHHAGGTTSVRVHHGRVGSGWVWLGNYFFAAGTGGCVEILNDAPEETSTANVVVADAIRFGNGMGDISRGNAGVSGYERELEASRYWIQRQVLDSVGYSSSLYDLSDYYDQSDNVGAPPRMAVNMVRTNGWARWRRVYIGFHSNAGSGSTRGTWGLYDTRTLQNYPSTYGLYQTNFASIVAKRCQADLSVAAAEGIVPSWTTSSRIYGSSYGEIYGGSIYLAMDAIINEVAFHDNAYDAAVMKTLAGREWLARASARGTAEFLSRQYSAFPNALVFPPDAPVGVRAVADGTTVTVGWRMPAGNAASGGAPDGFTVYASTNGTAFGRPVSVPGGNTTSVVFEGLEPGQTLFFRVAATNAGGESASSAVAGARTPDGGGKSATLVVSAFVRADAALSPKRYLTHYCASSGGGNTTLVRRRGINDRSYVKEHGLALAANGEAFDSCEADAVTLAFLTGYRNVVWCLGEESTDDETFSAEEQAMVSAFLAGGGNLFASGAEIAWDLGAKGSASDAEFLASLGAAYAADSGGTGNVTGAAGGIFAGTALSFNYTNLLDTTYAAEYPDVLASTNGAKVAAVYGLSASGSSAAAVAYSNATYRTVVMGFPFELIGSESARTRAMGQVLDFFAAEGGGTATGTGGLRFDLTPAEATWTAGGVSHASGETAVLAEGTYTVAFSDAAGYVTPEARTVAVAAGATNAVSVAYEAASGALCIALVPGNGTWTLGGAEYASGETVQGLPQGDYSVSFSPVAGYATPAARTFAVAAGETNAFTVAYEEMATGTVTFTLVPPTGTWTIDGTTNASGDTVTLPAGTYTVTFGEIEGYTAPAATNVTVVAGGAFAGTATYTENEEETLAAPVLAAATAVTTNSFSIAWGAVSNATGYVLQIAETEDFDEAVVLSESFADAALPAGWANNKVSFATNKVAYAGDGAGVAVFAGSNQWLRTKAIANPGLLSWWHATTSNTNAWTYVVECSATEDFATVLRSRTFEVATPASATEPARQCLDLTGLGEVFVRWRDARANGTAQRYISAVTAFSALAASAETAQTSSSFAGLSAGTTYFVRAMATNATLASEWSASRTVTTEAAPEPTTGTVRFTLVPAEGTSWTINDTTYASGETATVEEGTYTVTFGELDGYDTPAATNVTVLAGETFAGNATYTEAEPEDGFLTFTLEPAEGTTWMVAGTTNASGETVSLPAGNYTVSFGALSGYTRPSNRTVSVVSGQTTSEHAAYAVKQVPLTVKLSPTNDAGLQAEARWSIEGMDGTHASGESVKVDPGTYTVTANDVDGWTTPAPTNVTINVGASSKTVTMKYVEAPVVPTTGTVTFTLVPATGTSWTIGGNTYASGQTATLEAGTYEVTFGALDGYETPAAQQVVVTAGQTVTGSATYSEIPAADGILTFTLVPAEGTTWIVAGTTNASGDAVTLPAGIYTVSFGALSGYTKPTNRTVSVRSGETTSETAAYTVKQVPLTVKLSPTNDAGLQAEARWSIAGLAGTHASGESVKVDPGTWTVSASDVDGWTTPAPTNVTINLGASSKTITMKYVEAPVVPTTGTVTFTLVPAVGTSWTIDGNTYASGQSATVEEGTYTVTFGALDGYETPAAQQVVVTAGQTVTGSATYTEQATPIASPVLGEATGVTTGAFSIAWSGVAGATGYTVQVAESEEFDEAVLLSEDFTGALPDGWDASAILTNATTYAPGGKGAVVFKGAGKYLRTERVANPGRLVWHHATGSTNEWRYEVQCSSSETFEPMTLVTNIVTTSTLKTPVALTADLSGYKDVYVRWLDTRPSGTAQRYISGITLTAALAAEETTAGTDADFAGLSAGTVYHVRAKAVTATGESDWSAVRTVRTSDPPLPPAAPVLEKATDVTSNAFSIAWGTVEGAGIYQLQVADTAGFDEEPILAESFAETPSREQWTTTAAFATNKTPYSGDGSGVVTFTKNKQYLVSPRVASPGTLKWFHATTTSTAAWSYRLDCSPDATFATVSWTRDYTVESPQTTPVEMAADLRGQKNVYIRWTDTREGTGTAQRYISAVSLTGALVTNATITARERRITGLSAETTYWVRVRAWGDAGWSEWSGVGSVTTDPAPAAPTTGTVTFTLVPAEGTSWSIGGNTYSSGETATVEAGTYTVSFGPLDGYETPASTNVTVAAGDGKAFAVAYEKSGGGEEPAEKVELILLPSQAGTDGLRLAATEWPDAFAVEFTTNLVDTNAWTLLPASEWSFSGGELSLPATNAFSAFRLVAP